MIGIQVSLVALFWSFTLLLDLTEAVRRVLLPLAVAVVVVLLVVWAVQALASYGGGGYVAT